MHHPHLYSVLKASYFSMPLRIALLIKLCITTTFLLVTIHATAQQTTINNTLGLTPVATDLPSSWAVKASPNNFLYVTHRRGTLAKYTMAGELVALIDLALDDLYYSGQGGLSAIAFHPNFSQTPWIYMSYSYGDDGANGLKVIRVKLSDSNIGYDEAPANNETGKHSSIVVTQQETIFEQVHLRGTAVHYGARLAFLSDNTLLVTTGDGFDYREQAQVASSDMGKIMRVTDVGGIPNNNPFIKSESFTQKATYSLGHRNPQGLIVLADDTIIAHEHGPAGGDEINFIEPGANYGWPVITQGKDYIGSLITPFTEYAGMMQPSKNWTPSIAPSGLAFYGTGAITPFNNRLLVTSLKFKQLHGLTLNGNVIEDEVVFFADSPYRMRDITVSNTGRVFILSDGDTATLFEAVMN